MKPIEREIRQCVLKSWIQVQHQASELCQQEAQQAQSSFIFRISMRVREQVRR